MTRKEATERIKARFDKWALDDEDMKAIQTIIPELAESEDERIKKIITDSIFYQYGAGAEYKDVLDYLDKLEKQKEPENVSASTMAPSCWEVEQKEQKPKAKAKSPLSPHELYDAKIEGISQGRQDVIDHPERFGLQKPAEWSEEDVLNRAYEEGFNDGLKYRKPVNRSDEDRKMAHWLIGLVNANTELSFSNKTNLTRWLEHLTIEKELSKNDKRIIDAIMIGYQDKDFRSSQIPTPIGVSKDEVINWLKSLHPQPKQEWSEEDEEKIVTISEIIEHCTTIPYSGGTLTLNKEYKKELLCFIKSLRPQPKQEWSEEDEEMLDSIIRVVCGVGIQPNGLREKQVSFLKALRPDSYKNCNSRWKPSEEQMKAFEDAMSYIPEFYKPKSNLASLLRDLKKL